MNGSNGIVPTVDLATNNGYGYPVYPMMGGYGNNGFFSGEGIWAIVLLAMLFNNGWGGFGGFGGFGGGLGLADGGLLGYAIGNNATKSDLSDGLFSVQNSNKLDNITTQIADGFANNATNICGLRSDVLENRYAAQLSACNIQRDILTQTNELNTNLLTQALQNQAHVDSCCCEIKSLIREDGEKTRALITSNTIQDLRDKLTQAKDIISDREQTDNLLSRLQPTPTPSYIVSSPYQSILNPYYGGCGCGNYYGSNII